MPSQTFHSVSLHTDFLCKPSLHHTFELEIFCPAKTFKGLDILNNSSHLDLLAQLDDAVAIENPDDVNYVAAILIIRL